MHKTQDQDAENLISAAANGLFIGKTKAINLSNQSDCRSELEVISTTFRTGFDLAFRVHSEGLQTISLGNLRNKVCWFLELNKQCKDK